MRKYLTEFIGTFFLVLVIGLCITGGTIFAPLAIGCALMVVVYMGGHISGGHYNPAVSLAAMMRGALDSKDLIPYWVSQIVGGLVAALVVFAMVGQTFAPAPGADASTMGALLAEFLFTFTLCLVVLNSATAKATEGNSFYGLAIGFTLVVGAFSVGGISGAAFNPAVGIGPVLINATMGSGGFGDLWLYLVGPLLGGALAPIVFKMQNPDDD